MNKIRVMFAMGGSMKRAGAETMIMQYLRQLVKDDRFEFSILVHGYDKGDYDDEIATFGVPIYHVPVRGKHPLTYTHEVKKVLKTHPADIIHCNMDSACGDFLTIAKECGIEIRIAHSHLTHFQASTPIKILVAKKSKERIHEVATIRLACSEKAGKWLYEEDAFSVINNAIDLEEYTPDSGKREEMRSEFGLSQEETAIVNIGRFHYQKNHKKLLDIFASYRQQYNKGVLFLVGTGELIDQIKEYTGIRIESAADLCCKCLDDVAMDVLYMTGNDHALEAADPLELAEIKRRWEPYINQLPDYAYLCKDLLNGKM